VTAPLIDPGWARAVSAWINAHRHYPIEAQRRFETGRVVVRFMVARDGQVEDVTLVQGSGHHRLDDATLSMLRGATLPPFAPGMAAARIPITEAVIYALD
jgi:protein TonB